MGKIKYYQIAFKGIGVEQVYKKLTSPSKAQIDSLITDGWTCKGSVNPFTFIDPILVDNVIREKTEVELQADTEAKFQAEVDSLNSCSKLELCEALEDLDEINNVTSFTEMFEGFKAILKFDLTNDFDFNHKNVKPELEKLDPAILQSIKEQIIKNRA